MSELLKKSDENWQAALLLWTSSNWYAPSVHCSYYRCIQKIIHTIIAVRKIEESIIEQEIKTWFKSKFNTGGSHFYYFDQVKRILTAQGKLGYIREFYEILSLKEFRENSDYKEKEISPANCEDAYELSDKIVKLIDKQITI